MELAEMAAKRMVCPKCGRADAVRKVSSIVSEGTFLTDIGGLGLVAGDRGGDLVGMMGASTSRSFLVEQLSPPRKPVKPFGYGCIGLFLFTRLGLAWFALLMIIAAVACSFPLLITSYRENPLLLFIPMTMVAGVGVALLYWILTSLWREVRVIREDHTNFPLRYQAWRDARARWQQLYYCARDDGVFLPTRTGLVPAAQMKHLLYESPKQKR